MREGEHEYSFKPPIVFFYPAMHHSVCRPRGLPLNVRVAVFWLPCSGLFFTLQFIYLRLYIPWLPL